MLESILFYLVCNIAFTIAMTAIYYVAKFVRWAKALVAPIKRQRV